jgi:hypothetical protein
LKSCSSRPEKTKADSPFTEKKAPMATAVAPEPSTVSDRSEPSEPEPEDDELERRMVAAEIAGRHTVADALARRLDAKRRERRANVVDLGTARSMRRPQR